MSSDLDRIVDAYVTRYTVGLLRVSESPTLIGSGTLIRCVGTQGILTCAHVVDELPPDKNLGIVAFGVRPDQRQAIQVPGHVSLASAIKFCSESYTRDGPDLSFIPLPATEFAKLDGIASTYDLALGSEPINPPSSADIVVEIVAGVVGEMTPPTQKAGSRSVMPAEGLAKVGRIVDPPVEGDWDIIRFIPKDEPGLTPASYGGTSGGGIWRLYCRENAAGKYECTSSRLRGVAYWQEKADDESAIIIGHGPKDVYDDLVNSIARMHS